VHCDVGEQHRTDYFWGQVSPCEHLVEFYEDEGRFLDMLARFVLDGLGNREAVVAIANVSHLATLRARVAAAGFDVPALQACGRYVPLDAAATLSQIMVDGWPDEARFEHVIGQVIAHARRDGRAVRAFGEMVALLWGQGQHDAALRLERLWDRHCSRAGTAVLCAYPRIGATRDLTESVAEVCALHSQVRGVAVTC
jgi:hypothetical protein